jgi:hypothetical protein
LKLAVLLLQIGNCMLECVTRRLPFLLLRSVWGRWAPHLKLQLLAELCNQALKLTVKFAVLSLQIGSLLLLRVMGDRLSASISDRRLLCLSCTSCCLTCATKL